MNKFTSKKNSKNNSENYFLSLLNQIIAMPEIFVLNSTNSKMVSLHSSIIQSYIIKTDSETLIKFLSNFFNECNQRKKSVEDKYLSLINDYKLMKLKLKNKLKYTTRLVKHRTIKLISKRFANSLIEHSLFSKPFHITDQKVIKDDLQRRFDK